MKSCPALLALCCASALRAEPLPSDPWERRCWLSHTNERTFVDLREPMAVHFSNLRSGYRVRSPFAVEFGVRGMGVIPAGNPDDKAGHHHILIDTPLPRDYQAPIPFSDRYKHFGKGQTGTVLDLPRGRHTLRLLFADHAHRPFFVFSPEVTIEVVGKRSDPAPTVSPDRFEASCAAWYADQRSTPRAAGSARAVYVKNLRAEEAVNSPFTLSLGVAGLGVAPANTHIKDTGHFRVTVLQAKNVTLRQDLTDGRTETTVDLPAGDYELQPAFVDGQGQLLLSGELLKFSIARRLR